MSTAAWVWGSLGLGYCPWGDCDFCSLRWRQEVAKQLMSINKLPVTNTPLGQMPNGIFVEGSGTPSMTKPPTMYQIRQLAVTSLLFR